MPIARHSMWEEVGRMVRIPFSSTVLQQRRGYRRVLQHFSLIRLAPMIPLDKDGWRDLRMGSGRAPGVQPALRCTPAATRFRTRDRCGSCIRVGSFGSSGFPSAASRLCWWWERGERATTAVPAEVVAPTCKCRNRHGGRLTVAAAQSTIDSPVDRSYRGSSVHPLLLTRSQDPVVALLRRSDMRILVIAGPNGAGKTTFARHYLEREGDRRRFVKGCGRMAGVRQFRRGSGSSGGVRRMECGPRAGHEVAAIGPHATNHRCRKATDDRATLEVSGRGTIAQEHSRRPRPRTEGRHAKGSRIRSPGSGEGSGGRRR